MSQWPGSHRVGSPPGSMIVWIAWWIFPVRYVIYVDIGKGCDLLYVTPFGRKPLFYNKWFYIYTFRVPRGSRWMCELWHVPGLFPLCLHITVCDDLRLVWDLPANLAAFFFLVFFHLLLVQLCLFFRLGCFSGLDFMSDWVTYPLPEIPPQNLVDSPVDSKILEATLNF